MEILKVSNSIPFDDNHVYVQKNINKLKEEEDELL